MPNLTEAERELLAAGVGQWGGPASPTHALAVALGVADVPTLLKRADTVHDVLQSNAEVSDDDLVFALQSTEINFASDRFGAGVEWATVTGYDDLSTVTMLRAIQIKLVGLGR